MIDRIEIKNFKSIKELNLNCSRINLFIGEPNTGKSNILESLGILSSGYTRIIEPFVRFEETTNLFYDNLTSKHVSISYISFDKNVKETKLITGLQSLSIRYANNNFTIQSDGTLEGCKFNLQYDTNKFTGSAISQKPIVKSYRTPKTKDFKSREVDFLRPPNGDNLPSIILTNKKVKEFVVDVLGNYGYKILMDNHANKISIARELEDVITSHPYSLIADTISRVIYYYAILETNNNSIIVLEEPEAHVFPFYNKFLAERIALYDNNQFFIATHNPTFLANLIEQSSNTDLKVFITYYEDYQTKVYTLRGNKLQAIYEKFGTDIFANLDKIIHHSDKILSR